MIKVLNHTKCPLTQLVIAAAICYNTELKDNEHPKRIALQCIKSGHTRVMEFADITLEIDGYSARVMREFFRHVIGTSFLQASTRYIEYDNFEYYKPNFANEEVQEEYDKVMKSIMTFYETTLEKAKDKEQKEKYKEHLGNVLPLAMHSKVVVKINARALAHLFNLRMCNKAYVEFRRLCVELKRTIERLDNEWCILLSQDIMQTKCVKDGRCTESKSCGFYEARKKLVGGSKDE